MFYRILLAAAILAACLPVAVRAQQTMNHASLHGSVLDPTGAIIVGASVVVQNTENGFTTAVTSTANGFQLSYLPPGPYEIKATAPNFLESTLPLFLAPGMESAHDITLQIRPTTDSIDVTSPGITCCIDPTATIDSVTTDSEILDIPLLSRNIFDLALLVPGVSATNTASTQLFAETSAVPEQGLSFNSQRNFSNAFLIDGLSAGDDASGLLQTTLPLDSIDTLNIITGGGNTEFGRALGGFINFTTKAGNNHYHGSAYGQLRNQRLNAANALSQSALPMTQTIFGASFGGPIVHNHAWFFLAAEQRNLNQNGIDSISPASVAAINTTLRAVLYPGQLLAVPASSTTLYPNPSHATNVFARFDEHIGNREIISARYNFYKVASQNSRNAGSLSAPSAGAALYDTDHNIAISNIFTINPNMVNETRSQYTHSRLDAPANDPVGPAVSISGIATFGTLSSSPTARYDDLYELVDNFNFFHHKHNLRFGVDFLYNALIITYPQSIRGNYAFSSLANFQAGKYSTFTQSFGNPIVPQSNPNLSLYMEDEYRPTRRLTVSAGIRYDLQFLNSVSTSLRNIAPRFGFSWQPVQDKTVISGAYGLFYDRVPLRALSNALESDANSTDLNANTFVTLALSNGQAGAPVFPAIDSGYIATNVPSNLRVSLTTMDPHLRNAYSQGAHVSIQQLIATATTLEISYQHVRGEHLLISINRNSPTCTSAVDPINLCRPLSAYANNKQYSSSADSTYDSLEINLVRSFHTWGSYRASYTLSHGFDDVGEFFFSAPINNSVISEDWARSDDDQRHRLSLDAVLHSPTSSAATFLQNLTHHWQTSGVLQYTSSFPFSAVTGATTIQTTAQRPCAPGFSLTASNGVNPCTLALPGAVIARNTAVGFDYFNLNTRFARSIPLPHEAKLDVILEAFNILNHRNNQIPNATFGTGTYPTAPSATFNQPTAVGDPRSLQLALRLSF